MIWPAELRICAAHSRIVPAASTVIVPPVFCAPTEVPASTRSIQAPPVDFSVMWSPSAMLCTSRTYRSPPALTSIAPSAAEMRSITRPVASLTVTLPAPDTFTVSVSTRVLSFTSPVARTFRSSAMKTEAPSVVMDCAARRNRPVTSLAATMPPRTVKVPSMSSVTSRA